MTATPERLDGRGLRRAGFTRLLQGPSVAWLVEQGFLSHSVVHSIPFDIDPNTKTVAGDYEFSAVDADVKMKLVGFPVEEYLLHAKGQQAIAFSATRELSQKLADQFFESGVNAVHLDGKTVEAERKDTLKRFREKKIKVLCNVDLFSEGLDVPDCSCIILARPTKSRARFLQMVGRGLRPNADGLPCTILDCAGNYKNWHHEAPTFWSLDGWKEATESSKTPSSPQEKVAIDSNSLPDNSVTTVVSTPLQQMSYSDADFNAELDRQLELIKDETLQASGLYFRMRDGNWLTTLDRFIAVQTVQNKMCGYGSFVFLPRAKELDLCRDKNREDFNKLSRAMGWKLKAVYEKYQEFVVDRTPPEDDDFEPEGGWN